MPPEAPEKVLRDEWKDTIDKQLDPEKEIFYLNDTLGDKFKTDINLLQVIDLMAQDSPDGNCNLFIGDKDKKNVRCINKFDCINISHTFLGLAAAFIENMKDIPEENLNKEDKKFKEKFNNLTEEYDKMYDAVENEIANETDIKQEEEKEVSEEVEKNRPVDPTNKFEFTENNTNSLVDSINADFFIPNDIKIVDLQDTYDEDRYIRYKLPEDLQLLKYDLKSSIKWTIETEKCIESIIYQIKIDTTKNYAVFVNSDLNYYNQKRLRYSVKVIPFIQSQTQLKEIKRILKSTADSVYKRNCSLDFYIFQSQKYPKGISIKATDDDECFNTIYKCFEESGTDYYDVINFNNENCIRIIKRNEIPEEKKEEEEKND